MDGQDKILSQFDGLETLRSAHQDENQAFRVTNANTSVPPKYSRVAITYNVEGSVINARFYKGELAEIRRVMTIGDSAGSLNNSYFSLYSEYDRARYHVWYNVSGSGAAPVIAGSVAIEVPIETNDSAEMVAIATALVLSKFPDFTLSRNRNLLTIENSTRGISTDTTDSGTGFTFFLHQNGTEVLIKSIDIPFDGTVRYLFNEQEREFVVVPFSDITVTVTAGETMMVGTEDGTTTGIQHVAKIGSDLNLRVKDENALVELQAINTNLSNLNIEALTEPTNPDNILVVGVDNGLKTGNKYAFIYNQRQQILATQDRQQDITYADFGTKDQRVTQIDYTSSMFPGITARKIITYTLVSTRYRRDSIDWSIV